MNTLVFPDTTYSVQLHEISFLSYTLFSQFTANATELIKMKLQIYIEHLRKLKLTIKKYLRYTVG